MLKPTFLFTKRPLWFISFLMLLALLLSACTSEPQKEVVVSPPEEKIETIPTEEVIQSVIEKEFNGPDETYKQLLNTAMAEQSVDMSEEDYEAYTESPSYQNLLDYTTETYESSFTADGLETFIKDTPAFLYSSFDGDYQLQTADIVIIQSEAEPTSYSFAFDVNYSTSNSDVSSFPFEGVATVPEPGKIGEITFTDVDGLSDQLNQNNF